MYSSVIEGVNNDDISLWFRAAFTLKQPFYPNMWLGGGLNPEQWFRFKVKTSRNGVGPSHSAFDAGFIGPFVPG